MKTLNRIFIRLALRKLKKLHVEGLTYAELESFGIKDVLRHQITNEVMYIL